MLTVETPVQIGQIIHNAWAFNCRHWSETRMNATPFPEAVADLFRLLQQRQIDYMLVGGIALLQYVEGRNTEDIDLIMAVQALAQLPELQITSQDTNFARAKFQGLQIDILLTRNRLFRHIRHHYVTQHGFMGYAIPWATVEGLLLLKLYALPSLYRQGNFARVGLYEHDIASLLHYYQPDLARLWAELTPHLSETDLQSVQDIVQEIQQRLRRFGTTFATN